METDKDPMKETRYHTPLTITVHTTSRLTRTYQTLCDAMRRLTEHLRFTKRVRGVIFIGILIWGTFTMTILHGQLAFSGAHPSLPRRLYFAAKPNPDEQGEVLEEPVSMTTAACREKALRAMRRAESENACLHCPDQAPVNASLPVCQRYKLESLIKRGLLINVLDSKVNVRSWNVTLVTQLSPRRFDRLENIANSWHGTISAAVYIHSPDSWALLLSRICTSNILKHRTNIFFHLVFKSGALYPTNLLRNVALRGAPTPYVFVIDIDFLLSPKMDEELHVMLRNTSTCKRKYAWVVPSFATTKLTHGTSKMNLVADNNQLLSLLEQSMLQVYQGDFHPARQLATDVDRWLLADHPYEVSYQRDYEPYVVTRKKETPYYPRQFVGKRRNKSVHTELLHYLGFQFAVLPRVYMVHLAHLDQNQRDAEAETYKQCVEDTYKEFKKDFFKRLQNLNTSIYYESSITDSGIYHVV